MSEGGGDAGDIGEVGGFLFEDDGGELLTNREDAQTLDEPQSRDVYIFYFINTDSSSECLLVDLGDRFSPQSDVETISMISEALKAFSQRCRVKDYVAAFSYCFF